MGRPMNLEYVLKIGLWIVPVVLQLLMAAAMVRRRLVRQFTFFFSYCVYAPARDVILFFLQSRPNPYSWVYWVGEGVSIVLQLLILWEVIWYLIRPYPKMQAFLTKIFKAVVVLSVVFALWLFGLEASSAENRLMEMILLAERSARIIQVIMLIATTVFIWRLGLTWKHYASGIILGSGLAGFQLVPIELRASLHVISNKTFIWLMPAVYDFAVIVWAVYFLPSQKPAVGLTQVPQSDLSGWDDILKRYLSRQ